MEIVSVTPNPVIMIVFSISISLITFLQKYKNFFHLFLYFFSHSFIILYDLELFVNIFVLIFRFFVLHNHK